MYIGRSKQLITEPELFVHRALAQHRAQYRLALSSTLVVAGYTGEKVSLLKTTLQ